MERGDAEWIWEMSIPEPMSGCWLWLGSINNGGYPRFKMGDKSVPAHRRSLELAHGQVPEDLSVCHRCDVRCCVNPAHLFVGTHQDNMADRKAKGRNRLCGVAGDRNGARTHPERMFRPKGQDNPLAVLNDAAVVAIKAHLARGLMNSVIAKEFGVDPSTISNIKHGKTWSHVPPAKIDSARNFSGPGPTISQEGST
jgi:ribosome-binding protein aMBF1 (putative translation factor)